MIYTLVSEGRSDAVLVPVLQKLLVHHGDYLAEVEWADPQHFPQGGQSGLSYLAERLLGAIQAYPADFYFVHRDADTAGIAKRQQEIAEAVEQVRIYGPPEHFCVVPIQETEAWLLVDEAAVREAVGRDRGTVALPGNGRLEELSQPKEHLTDLLKTMSKIAIHIDDARSIIGEKMDWKLLRGLTAFDMLESDVQTALQRAGF